MDDKLENKPSLSVEGACASGGLSLISAMRSVLSGTAEVVLSLGVEVQNTVKAIYGADVLAGAGWFQNRKKWAMLTFSPDSFLIAQAFITKIWIRLRTSRNETMVCECF